MFMRAAVRALEAKLNLPRRAPIRYHLGDETGWANHYGGVEQLVRYCGMIDGLRPGFNATWQHGISLPWVHRYNPKDLVYCYDHDRSRLILVANDDQRISLSSIGYTNVCAVGSPWVYAQPKLKDKRIKGSLLVMPPHTLDNAPFEKKEQLFAYCDYIARKYHDHSSLACACIHMSGMRNGQLTQLLDDCGFNMITGADHYDRNSLVRMWKIFNQFETVSTPAIGSHVFYALAAGCNVVIEGPKVAYTHDQLLLDVSYRRSLSQGLDVLENPVLQESEMQFERMFERPLGNKSLGLEIVGINYKKTPDEIKHILDWSRRQQVGHIISRHYRHKILGSEALSH